MTSRTLARRALRRLATSRAGPPLLAVRRAVKPELRRDRRDTEHLRLLLTFLLAPDSNCVDVGSHLGEALREMVRIAPDGRHIAFEPLPDFHARLAEEFPNVDVRAVALSDHDGEESFTYVRSRPGYSGFRPRRYPSEEELDSITVPVATLDSSLPDGYVPALIKVDVEGAEQQLFEGALGTLRKHRPVIVFEHGLAAKEYGTEPRTLFDLLSGEVGLRIFDLDGDGPYSRDGFVQTCERGNRWNFVAHV